MQDIVHIKNFLVWFYLHTDERVALSNPDTLHCMKTVYIIQFCCEKHIIHE
jgi:hypothetical protein